MPSLPVDPVELPGCQQNWEFFKNQSGFSGTVSLGNAVSSGAVLTFANITQKYKHLHLMVVGQSQRAGFQNTGLRLNVNGAVNWNFGIFGRNGGAAVSSFFSGNGSAYIGQTPAGSRVNDNYVSHHVIEIPYYTEPTVKTVFSRNLNADGTNYESLEINNSNVGSNLAITTITIFDDVGGALGPRAKASLYGIT